MKACTSQDFPVNIIVNEKRMNIGWSRAVFSISEVSLTDYERIQQK